MFPIPFMVCAWSHLTQATCVPYPRVAMTLPGQCNLQVCVHLQAHGCQGRFLLPFFIIRPHCLESCNTSDLCPGSRFDSEILHTEAQVTSVAICRPMGCAGALSWSFRSQFIESFHTSDLCTGCMFGGNVLHTEAPCQVCVHLLVHLCQGLFLVPLIVIA